MCWSLQEPLWPLTGPMLLIVPACYPHAAAQRRCNLVASPAAGRLISTGASGAPGSHEPVVMTLDFGEVRPLQRVEILWEFPAKSFSIALSSDGLSWGDVYSIDLNGLKDSIINLGHQSARKLRLSMREVVGHHASCLCMCVVAPTGCAGASVTRPLPWPRRVWNQVFKGIFCGIGHCS